MSLHCDSQKEFVEIKTWQTSTRTCPTSKRKASHPCETSRVLSNVNLTNPLCYGGCSRKLDHFEKEEKLTSFLELVYNKKW